jgi:D-lactate dehydrogenase
MINASSLALMKHGVMLINTSRGALINTSDLPEALDQGKIGYLGMDVYEFEDSLFYSDHSTDAHRDPLLAKLLTYPNVIITPHQAFLTNEAVEQIATTTLENLNNWETALNGNPV